MKHRSWIGFSLFLLAVGSTWGETKTFFRVGQSDGVWHFVTPEGKPFLSFGVNVVVPQDTAAIPGQPRFDALAKQSDLESWAKSAVLQLKSWNMNTIGAWSHPSTYTKGLPYTVYLNLAASAQHRLVDVWSDAFARKADAVASKLAAYKNDPLLIGYFLENEQPWFGDASWGTGHASTLLDLYVALPASAPGRKIAQGFLEKRYATFQEFAKVWETKAKSWKDVQVLDRIVGTSRKAEDDRTAFVALVAQKWYKTVVQAVKTYDPNHLILGDRFASKMPPGLVEACGQWCDVVSVNHYKKNGDADVDLLGDFWMMGKKPVLITEFSYRATENNSADRNTLGADVTVPTQAERAAKYKQYVSIVSKLPWIVGWHWFQYFDESPGGRSFDGEDSNYGLLDIYGKEYEPIVQAMRETNSRALSDHFERKVAYPTRMTWNDGYLRWSPATKSRERREWTFAFDARTWNVWSDFPSGGRLNGKSGRPMPLRYETGTGWGCGISFRSDWENKNPDGSSDLTGYRGVRFVVQAPRGLKFQLFISESGAQDAWKDAYAGWAGADGESAMTGVFEGTGEAQEYVADFGELQIRTTWGNQRGNKTLDVQAIAQIDLSILGKQGSGELSIHSVELF